MATEPQSNLPLLYSAVVPLNGRVHGNWRARPVDKLSWVAKQHAIPLTVDEFPVAQRDYPIVFSSREDPVPLALMGLNEGVNMFFDDEGAPLTEAYIPGYLRRYPFLLARANSDSQETTLCFDPNSGLLGD